MLNYVVFVLLTSLSFCSFIHSDSLGRSQEYNYIAPSLSNYVDEPLPMLDGSDLLLGIYGNIFYPQDLEQALQIKLNNWVEAYFENEAAPFPVTADEMNDLSLYILERFPLRTLMSHFGSLVHQKQIKGLSLEQAIEESKRETLARAKSYGELANKIPESNGRFKMLKSGLLEMANQIESTPALLTTFAFEPIVSPFNWEMRIQVFKQMVDKILAASANASYFLALQEVTPLALEEFKKALVEKDLQWISFNNLSEKETLLPKQEEIFGEATAFTSTIALSKDLKVIKVELGDLPTESGSIRKIVGVRVQNGQTDEIYNLFSTHTDHKIQNEIYLRTAIKIHEFVTEFVKDTQNQKFIFGGDLNAFEGLGGDQYVKTLRELFPDSQDFRESNFYAPYPISTSTYIGKFIENEGKINASALDHILVGNGIVLDSSHREAGVYSSKGELLDYYTDELEYVDQLRNKVTFSDHFFNIVRCR